jgi:ABC-type Fe3+ transport system substrate-binding protein
MAGGNLDECSEALKPLLEITDPAQRVDLAKDVMPFAAKVFAANNRRLDEVQIDEILKPIFKGKERAMIKTIFEEREEVAEARGQAKGETITWRKAVLAALHGKFGKVPKGIEKMVQSMSDPIALESLVVRVGQCKTLDEFATDL